MQAAGSYRGNLVSTATEVATWARFTMRDPARAETLYRRTISLQSEPAQPLAAADVRHFKLADLLRFDLHRPREALVEYRAIFDVLGHSPILRESPIAPFVGAMMQGLEAEIEYVEKQKRFSEPVNPTSFFFGMLLSQRLAMNVESDDPAIGDLWALLGRGHPGAAERQQAATRLETLSPSILRFPATFNFLPVFGSADRVAAFLRRHDPSGYESMIAFAVVRESARQAPLRSPASGEGVFIATWSEQDRAIMQRAEAIVFGPVDRKRAIDPRRASPEAAWRAFLAAFRGPVLGEAWRFTTPAFRRRNAAAFAAMRPDERAAFADDASALVRGQEAGEYLLASFKRPDGKSGQAAFVRYRGEWLLADM